VTNKNLFRKIIKYVRKNFDPIVNLSVKKVMINGLKFGYKPASIKEEPQKDLVNKKFMEGVRLNPS
tara:strand:+ start:1783 stop:1980 length:198 start_codon:yes stop_codon:yes gene_type:complete